MFRGKNGMEFYSFFHEMIKMLVINDLITSKKPLPVWARMLDTFSQDCRFLSSDDPW